MRHRPLWRKASSRSSNLTIVGVACKFSEIYALIEGNGRSHMSQHLRFSDMLSISSIKNLMSLDLSNHSLLINGQKCLFLLSMLLYRLLHGNTLLHLHLHLAADHDTDVDLNWDDHDSILEGLDVCQVHHCPDMEGTVASGHADGDAAK